MRAAVGTPAAAPSRSLPRTDAPTQLAPACQADPGAAAAWQGVGGCTHARVRTLLMGDVEAHVTVPHSAQGRGPQTTHTQTLKLSNPHLPCFSAVKDMVEHAC